MIDTPGSRFLASESIGGLTRLEIVERLPGGERMRVAGKVDPATGRIATGSATGRPRTSTLTRPPEIPRLRPACKA